MLILAQSFGILAFLFGLITFLQKNDERLKLYMLCLFSCQIVHFYLMGAAAASAANVLNLVRTFVSLKFNQLWVGALFLILNVLWGAYLYQSPISILPILGSCFGTFSVFYLSGIKMRLALIAGAFCWITHNIYIFSIGGILLESIVIFGNLVTIYRLHKSKLV